MLSGPLSKNDLAVLKLPALKVEKFWTLLAKLAAKIENPYTRSKRFSLNIKTFFLVYSATISILNLVLNKN